MELDITGIAITVVVVVGMLFATKTLLHYQNSNSKYVKGKMKEQDEYVEYLKKQMRIYKNKVSNSQKPPLVDVNLSEEGAIEQAIPALIAKYGSMAPTWLKPLLNTPGIAKFAVDMAKEHPEEAKNLLSQFIGKKSDESRTNNGESSEESTVSKQYNGA